MSFEWRYNEEYNFVLFNVQLSCLLMCYWVLLHSIHCLIIIEKLKLFGTILDSLFTDRFRVQGLVCFATKEANSTTSMLIPKKSRIAIYTRLFEGLFWRSVRFYTVTGGVWLWDEFMFIICESYRMWGTLWNGLFSLALLFFSCVQRCWALLSWLDVANVTFIRLMTTSDPMVVVWVGRTWECVEKLRFRD